MSECKVLALVPARGGSKGVPGKNVRPVEGFPLIAYSIAAARLAKRVDRTIVTTDDPGIAEAARRFGAEVPFMRPAELAGDKSPDRGFVVHALEWLEREEGWVPDLVAHLRPTTPLRDPAVIDAAIAALLEDPRATSLRSAHELPEPPQKMFGIGPEGWFEGLFPHDPRPEYYNLPRQTFPPAYHPNGYVDILRSAFVRSGESLHGPRIKAFVTETTVEIDTAADLELLEFRVRRWSSPVMDHLRAPRP